MNEIERARASELVDKVYSPLEGNLEDNYYKLIHLIVIPFKLLVLNLCKVYCNEDGQSWKEKDDGQLDTK